MQSKFKYVRVIFKLMKLIQFHLWVVQKVKIEAKAVTKPEKVQAILKGIKRGHSFSRANASHNHGLDQERLLVGAWFHEDTTRRFPKWETMLVSKEEEDKMLLVS
ncbi:hypothetical protein ACSQ67_005957 [Phaseolus vulgaris]